MALETCSSAKLFIRECAKTSAAGSASEEQREASTARHTLVPQAVKEV